VQNFQQHPLVSNSSGILASDQPGSGGVKKKKKHDGADDAKKKEKQDIVCEQKTNLIKGMMGKKVQHKNGKLFTAR